MTFREVETKKDICPNCEEEREIKHGYKKETVIIRNEPIKIESEVAYCPTCGEFFADTETEERNIQKVYRKYRKIHDLLQPEEIREIREKYSISQRALSRLLGWGEITLHRYETGGLQDETHNNELILMKDPENFRVLFDRYRDKLAPRVITRVERRLEKLSEEDFVHRISGVLRLRKSDIYSGFQSFNEDKFENAVLYFTSQLTASVFRTKLNKLLWYFDFLTYKIVGVSATGTAYFRAPYGPVPEGYDFLIAGMLMDRALEPQEIVFDKENDVAGEILKALEDADLSVFSSQEKKCLKKVAESLGHLTSARISEISHREEGYKNTPEWEKISYEWAKDLKISL